MATLVLADGNPGLPVGVVLVVAILGVLIGGFRKKGRGD
jgi:hypothetical protein